MNLESLEYEYHLSSVGGLSAVLISFSISISLMSPSFSILQLYSLDLRSSKASSAIFLVSLNFYLNSVALNIYSILFNIDS